MTAKIPFFRITYFLSFLTLAFVSAEKDFKSDFGEKFGVALKRYNADLLKATLDNMKLFYNIVLRDMDLKPREQRMFRQHLKTIEEIKNQIGESVTPSSVKITTAFTKQVILELIMFRVSPDVIENCEKSILFDNAMKETAVGGINIENKFLHDLRVKWDEMYATIPIEELEKHEEYTEINDLLDNILNMDINMPNNLLRTIKIVEIKKKISRFFGYAEWNT